MTMEQKDIIGGFDRARGEYWLAAGRTSVVNRASMRPAALAPNPNESYMAVMGRVYDDSRERGYTEEEAMACVQAYDRMNARRMW